MFITFLVPGNDVISLKLIFMNFIHAISIIVEYDIKSNYPEEYSTIDKVGGEKLLVRKSCFMYNYIPVC